MSDLSCARCATSATPVVVTVLVEFSADDVTCKVVTSLLLSRFFGAGFSVKSADPEGTGGDENSMLGGRGLG
jgi:hypothetical protein